VLSGCLVGTIDALTQFVSPQPLDHVLELERELQTPACRADESRLRELRAPDFSAIGASGRRWDFDSIVVMLREESAAHDGDVIELTGLAARARAPGVVQVFWESERAGRRARRTSFWCKREGGWQQVYHEGPSSPEPSSLCCSPRPDVAALRAATSGRIRRAPSATLALTSSQRGRDQVLGPL